MIKVNNLVKRAGGKTILNNVSLEINKGERIALCGGNGAGKTTLIESIIGISKVSSGTIDINVDYKKSPLEKVGVQFQDSGFPTGLNVKDIIDFFVEKSIYADRAFKDKLVQDLKITEFLQTDAAKLSGGQSQKVNILLALINRPEILILDELTTGLDVFMKNMVLKVIGEYLENKDITLILVTHTPDEITALANRVAVMDKGSLTQDYSKDELMKKFGSSEEFLKSLS